MLPQEQPGLRFLTGAAHREADLADLAALTEDPQPPPSVGAVWDDGPGDLYCGLDEEAADPDETTVPLDDATLHLIERRRAEALARRHAHARRNMVQLFPGAGTEFQDDGVVGLSWSVTIPGFGGHRDATDALARS